MIWGDLELWATKKRTLSSTLTQPLWNLSLFRLGISVQILPTATGFDFYVPLQDYTVDSPLGQHCHLADVEVK